MIGVVVWSNGTREKAIIWCEDHAMLAYLQGRENLVQSTKWPMPGDLVELETKTVGNLRHALSVTLISEQSCVQLPQALADSPPLSVTSHLRVVTSQEPVSPASSFRPELASLELACTLAAT